MSITLCADCQKETNYYCPKCGASKEFIAEDFWGCLLMPGTYKGEGFPEEVILEKTTKSGKMLNKNQMNLEQMLAAFNSNMQENAAVLEYISRPNIFDTIGKARNEMAHSKMIAHLLSAYHVVGYRESPIIHLLDIIIKRSVQQDKVFPSELKNAVLTRALPDLQLEECKTEVLLSDLKQSYKGKERIDIHLLYKLKSTIVKSGRSEIELIIENKVQSQEHDDQTNTYYETLKPGKGKNNRYQFFLYLTPVSTRDLDDISNRKGQPVCEKFIGINYQDILDGIIEPLLAESVLSERERIILNDYVSCLELPALPDTNKDGVQEEFDMSIMATSTHERHLINSFLSKENNRQLIQLATSYVSKTLAYTYDGKTGLTFHEALSLALNDYIEHNSELSVLSGTSKIITCQNGGSPFIVWSPNGKQYVPCDLYVTEGKVYPNLYTAVAHSIISYAKNKGKAPSAVVGDFALVYGKQKNGKPLLSQVQQDGYKEFDSNFFIRTDLGVGKIDAISKKTEIQIEPVAAEVFHNLLMSDNSNLKDFLLDFNSVLYTRIPDTNYYYRHDTEKRIDAINKCLEKCLEKPIGKIDFSKINKDLLKAFYDNHIGLILSVHKIKTDNELDAKRVESQQKILKRLLNQNKKKESK